MKYRLLSLALALGAVSFAVTPGHAAQQKDYLAERAKYQVTTLQDSDKLAAQVALRPGAVIEVDGTVGGVVVGDQYNGYLLQRDSGESSLIAADLNNQDLTVGAQIRVLTKVPTTGTVLQQISEMQMDSPSAMASGSPQVNAPQATTVSQQPATAAGVPSPTLVATTSPKKTAAKPTPAKVSNKVQMYAGKIHSYNGKIDINTALKIATQVLAKSQQYGVDARLVFALLAQESGFNPKAVSPMGAQGLGQLMPGTAKLLGTSNPFDITQNIDATVRYLAQQIQTFNGNYRMALAAYNAGPGNVQRYGGIPPFRETQNYVRTISTHYEQLKASVL